MNQSVESGKQGSTNTIMVGDVNKDTNFVNGLLWFLSPRFHPSLAIHFDELKNLFAQEIQPKDQRLCVQESKGDKSETLNMSCLKDISKLLYMCSPASKERKLGKAGENEEIMKACEAISEIQVEVDKLSQRVSSLQASVHSGAKVDEKEFIISTELLMMQLLKLDSVEAKGEAKAQRKKEVHRIQRYVDQLDALKARNSTDSSL